VPKKSVIQRAKQAAKEGKAPSTQAGEFVREEMHHLHEEKDGPTSRKQAIAIGLSKAREAGVDIPPPPKSKTQNKKSTHASK
jgi:hypothetical protein